MYTVHGRGAVKREALLLLIISSFHSMIDTNAIAALVCPSLVREHIIIVVVGQ